MAISGGTVNDMLDTAYKIIGNPMVMIDLTYKLIYNSENTVKDDLLWNELIGHGVFTHKTVNFFKEAKFIEAYAESDIVTLMTHKDLKYDRINGKLFDANGIQIGDITVVACYRPFTAEDYTLISDLCLFISDVLSRQGEFGEPIETNEDCFIDYLITNKKINRLQYENTAGSLYSELKENLYVAVVDLIKYDPTMTHFVYFKKLFKKIQPEFKYFIRLNNIIILISTDDRLLNTDKDMKPLSDFFCKYNIFAGISGNFHNLFELRKYYKQAINALNYGMKSGGGRHIFKYDNYRFDCYINSIKNRDSIRELCSPLISYIREYDIAHGTAYFEIIRAYFYSGSNKRIASESLGMKYENFCDELNSISRIFGINWDDGNTKLNIYISVKLLEEYQ